MPPNKRIIDTPTKRARKAKSTLGKEGYRAEDTNRRGKKEEKGVNNSKI